MKKNYIPGAALFLALSLVLGGCGGKASATAAADYVVAETMAAAAPQAAFDPVYNNTAAAPAAAVEGAYDKGGDFYDYEMSEETVALSSLTDTSSIAQAPLANRKLIRNVSMSVETDAFDQLLENIQKKVTELSGYTEQSDISGNRTEYQNRFAWLTVRIPCDKLDQFIDHVESSGNVTRKSESVQDITLQYSDLESRKKTLTMEQERIWALLEKADSLEAVIALEQRLSEIRYSLESMESQLKVYDNQVDYSTVEISIDEVLPTNFTPTAPESIGQRIQKGFSRNITNMGEFLTDLLVGLIVLMPVWIPFAVIAALVIILIKRVLKKRAKRRGAAPAQKASEAADICSSSPSTPPDSSATSSDDT